MNPLVAFGLGIIVGAGLNLVAMALISYLLTEFDQQRDFDRQ